MKRKINCLCENYFEVEVPEEINLDSGDGCFDEIQNGTFMSFKCTSCGKKLKPEFLLTVLWPSKNLHFEVFPELDRGEFYRRKKESEGKKSIETIIGYPELADRLAVIRDGFEPAPIEAIKYFLHLKAEEQYPESELDIWYHSSTPDAIEFHIHGIREQESAVIKVPMSLYQKNLDDYKKNPGGEIFAALRVRGYLSVKNTMRDEALK